MKASRRRRHEYTDDEAYQILESLGLLESGEKFHRFTVHERLREFSREASKRNYGRAWGAYESLVVIRR